MVSLEMLKIVIMLCTTSVDSHLALERKESCVKKYVQCIDQQGKGGELLNFKACISQ